MAIATEPLVEAGRRLFTVAEFEHMMATGILAPDERVELVEGEILALSPIGPRHASTDFRVSRVLDRALGERAMIWNQNPIVLSDPRAGRRVSRPQPDLAVLRPRADLYASGLPAAEDVYFLVEIADSSVADDPTRKIPSYAHSDIPEVWNLVLGQNPADDALRVYTDPSPDGYRTVRLARRGETVTPLAFPDATFTVTDLLG